MSGGSRKAVLEVGTLFEDHWTGLSNVVAALAERALREPDIDWTFTYEAVPLPRDLIVRFLAQRSGAGGLFELSELLWMTPPMPETEAAGVTAIFPHIKPMRRYFGREAIIAHDLSPLLTPQYHNSDNIHYFANRFRGDVETADHIFCVSKATLGDVHAYFGYPIEKMSVIRLGAEFDPADLSAGLVQVRPELQIEPYVAVVGTLEPRKNGGLIFDYLIDNPDFAHRYKVVFVGRDGWMDEKGRLMKKLAEVGVAEDRIQFTGYLTNAERTALMMNSVFCVYPSFFEGFGLPILEAGALGKVTACSNSSSMPEVFPEQCVFFDPGDKFEFAQAMRVAEARAVQTRSRAQSLSDLLQRAAPHGWDGCYQAIARWVKEQ